VKESKDCIKILHIFGRMQRGGAEMRTVDVMRHVDRQRYQFHFCSLSGLPGTLDDEIRALGGKVHYLPLGASFLFRFRRLLRDQKIDVVHSHVHYFSGFILRLARKEEVPVRIAHFRSTDDGHPSTLRRRIQRAVTRYWIDRYSTNILAVSAGAMRESWGPAERLDHRCQVVYNGFDPDVFMAPAQHVAVRKEFGFPHDSKVYIHVGRMDVAKNHKRLICMFGEIVKREPAACLLLAGRGGNEVERGLRAQVQEMGLSNRVAFAGERSDVARLLKASDMMIFPSLWEGLPGAVLEACAAGIPVLASDLPGIIEIASRIPSVRHLSLNTSDHDWASVALIHSDDFGQTNRMDSTIKAFASSEFSISDCARKLCMVWEGASK
jgi:glycosyltransferase involved in cell wall biosynthesis